jgi:hypothetical protein
MGWQLMQQSYKLRNAKFVVYFTLGSIRKQNQSSYVT